MVMPNLYGNIVNNVCAGLVGGPGLVAGANYGHVYAVFETVSAGGSAAACRLSPVHRLSEAHSSHPVSPFKMHDLVVFWISRLYCRHHQLIPEHFHHPTRKACPHKLSVPTPSPNPWHPLVGFCPCGVASSGRVTGAESLPGILLLSTHSPSSCLPRLRGTPARVSPIRTSPTPRPPCWPAA